MKVELSRMWQSGLSMILAICLVIGMCPAVAFATETPDMPTEEEIKAYVELIAENYEEYYANAYAYAKDNGYIDAAIAAIDVAIEAVEDFEVPGTDAFQSEANVTIAEAVEAMEAAKVLIEKADKLDQESLDALLATLSESADALLAALAALEQAGEDLDAMVIIPALEAAYQALVNDVIPAVHAVVDAMNEYLQEQIGIACDVLVEATVAAVKKYAPVVDDAIYDYLYNNPDEVIEFFKAHGPEMMELVNVYGDKALAAIGTVLYYYGDDVAAYVVENPDEVMDTLIAWYETYGAEVWAMVDVYLNELGIYDAVENAAGSLVEILDELLTELAENAEALKGAVLDCAEEKINELLVEIDALIEQVEALLKSADEAVKAELEKVLDALEAMKDALEEMISGNVIKAVNKLKEAKVALETALSELSEQVVGAVNELTEAILDCVCDLLKEVDEAILEFLGDKYDELVDAIVEAAKKYAPELAEEICAYLYNNATEVLAFLCEYADELLDILVEYGEEALVVILNVQRELGEEIAAYIIDNAKAVMAELVAMLEQLGADAWAEIEAYLNELHGKVEETVNAAAAAIKAEILKQIEALEAELEALKAKLENVAGEAYDAVMEQIAIVEAKIAELKALLDDIVTNINDVLDAIAELRAEVRELIAAVKQAALDGVEALESVVDALNELEMMIVAYISTTVEELKGMSEEAWNELVARINQMILDATTGELTVGDDFKYVAIGDGSAASESYAEMIGQLLYNNGYEAGTDIVEYENVAAQNASISGVRENLPDVTGADLITVGFSNISFLDTAVEKALTSTRTSGGLDWAALVGEACVPYVEQLLAEITAVIEDAELDDSLTEVACAFVEAYAYCVVEYAVEMPKLVNELSAANPDALIVVIGMYNPLENVSVVMGDSALNIGAYMDYLVDVADIHGIGYAALTGNAVYVQVSGVETENADYEMDIVDLFALVDDDFAALYPSVTGHETIVDAFVEAVEVSYEQHFIDVPVDSYYFNPVVWAYYNGITAGKTANTYAPHDTCNRAQIMTFLWRAAGSPEPTIENPFYDVSENSYYYKAVLWAYENGITAGKTETTFAPADECTRAQAMTFLWRASGSPEGGLTESPFTDVQSHSYYHDAVLWAVELGITAGKTATTFASAETCTRAQNMTFLYQTIVNNGISVNN